MDEHKSDQVKDAEIAKQASRATMWIYICMAVMMLLPLLLAWYLGAIRF